VESSDDIVDEGPPDVAADDRFRSNYVWCQEGKRYELNSFHFGERDAWCYELYEVNADASRNDYLEVTIPDAAPEGGSFVPEPVDRVMFTAHGEWTIPWPVFRRFIETVQSSGDIVNGAQAAEPGGTG